MKKVFSKDGYELRESIAKGDGVFAIKPFKTGRIVMVGRIEKVLEANHSHASQIGVVEGLLLCTAN